MGLLTDESVWRDPVTNSLERVFPPGDAFKQFQSALPGKAVFANSVLDPAIGIAGDLAVSTFASADWANIMRAGQAALYEVATRVGLPPQLSGGATKVAQVFTDVTTDIVALVERAGGADTGDMAAEILKKTGNAALQALMLTPSFTVQLIAAVVQAGLWAFDVANSAQEEALRKNVALPPLQTLEPTTDTWQVNRVLQHMRRLQSGSVVLPDGRQASASNADYTSFFLPAYRYDRPWAAQWRADGVAFQQGTSTELRDASDSLSFSFDIGDGNQFGFMPGVGRMLRVLQASYKWYQPVRQNIGPDRYNVRCKGVDEDCWMTKEAFDGSKDCRQCVSAESVWPQEGLGWAYGGAPLNATTPGDDVGAFYPTANKLFDQLLLQMTQPGPMLFTCNVEAMMYQWEETFTRFYDYADKQWNAYRGGYGWRGLISRAATYMSAYPEPYPHAKDEPYHYMPGGRNTRMPEYFIANPRVSDFIPHYNDSLYVRLIRPYLDQWALMQKHYLQSLQVAYIPPHAGAIYTSSGKIRQNEIGDTFITERQALLTSPARMLIDLDQVSDPEYRAALAASGVTPSPVNPVLQQHLITDLLQPGKPRRAPMRPKRAPVTSPLTANVNLVDAAMAARQIRQGRSAAGPLALMGLAGASVYFFLRKKR